MIDPPAQVTVDEQLLPHQRHRIGKPPAEGGPNCMYLISNVAIKAAQIWIAVSMYVLAAIVRKRLELDASLYQTL
jgi:hypothetical protein